MVQIWLCEYSVRTWYTYILTNICYTSCSVMSVMHLFGHNYKYIEYEITQFCYHTTKVSSTNAVVSMVTYVNLTTYSHILQMSIINVTWYINSETEVGHQNGMGMWFNKAGQQATPWQIYHLCHENIYQCYCSINK